ncbi:MAG: septation protein SepH, partial [Actinomycetota bacterium]|nr:septation protein SepH [Actinomycetota bacterium]
MQQLHLVGFTTDHKGLIFAARRGSKEGSYVINLDQALVEQIEELLRRQAGESASRGAARAVADNGRTQVLRRPKIESRLTPREVQALMRTGRTVQEIAEAAGMSEDWVGRFAPPVEAEQARMVERATRLTFSKPRVGPSTQPLGESVTWNLAERGVVMSGPTTDAWSAFQLNDGSWVVRVSYQIQRRRQHADWSIDTDQGGLKALNRLGNELGYVEPGRRRPPALPPANAVSASAQRAASAPVKAPAPPLARPSGQLSQFGPGGGPLPPAPPALLVAPERFTGPRSSGRSRSSRAEEVRERTKVVSPAPATRPAPGTPPA